MYDGQMVFPQLLEFLPRRTFETCVRRYHGQKAVRALTCRDQFLAMMFAQLTGRQSLRDLVCCLSAMRGKLYHAGFRGEVCRSTLSDANRDRDWRISRTSADELRVVCMPHVTREMLESFVADVDAVTATVARGRR